MTDTDAFSRSGIRKAVVVQAGARDQYQLPLALYEGDLLDTLVTDLYWPVEHRLWRSLSHLRPIQKLAESRHCHGLDSRLIRMPPLAVAADVLNRGLGSVRLATYKDHALSRAARDRALQRDAALFSYSYYAGTAFLGQAQHWPYRFIFQIHPHSWAVRQLIREEWEMQPEARASLEMEYELALDEQAYRHLAEEPLTANGWVAASSYTASILAQQGIERSSIHVVPYGVNTEAYPARTQPPASTSPFTVIFVGSMIQRKGLSYLLDAIRLLKSSHVRLLLCGRGFMDEALLASNSDLPIEVHADLTRTDLVRTIHASDVMVLPSLVEGFAHVILEAMSCGVPVITTPNTCGPDVISEAHHGFIVPIRDPAMIAEKLAWGIDNRLALAEMGHAAAGQARLFTWERFRADVREAYRRMVASADSQMR